MNRERILIISFLGFFCLALFSPVFGQQVTITREYVNTPGGTVLQTNQVREFEYYPDAQVYFNASSKLWYWQENGKWQTGSELPARAAPAPRKVRLQIDEENPSSFHDHFFPQRIVKRDVQIISPPEGGYRYTYYPETEIFFDRNTNQYLWRDGGAWKVAESLPSTFRIDPSKAKSVTLDSDVRQLITP